MPASCVTSNTTREVSSDRSRAADQAFFPAGLIETGAHNIAMELGDKRNLHAMERVRSRVRFYL